MDTDQEMQRLKGGLIILGVVLISGWFSFTELRYAVWGRQAEAVITNAEIGIERGRRGRETAVLNVTYSYQDQAGTQRNESESLPVDTHLSTGEKAMVSYLPGVERSTRLSGRPNYFAVIMFLVSIATMIGFIVWIARQANAPIPTSRHRRKGLS
ncbi:MAG: hypothetical protein C0478_01030 [Planctomyces sp.]|nr:hypothetical protein [Planctomyces sp.]